MQRRHQIYSHAYAAATLRLLGYAPHAAQMPRFNNKGEVDTKQPKCERCHGSGCPNILEKVVFRFPATENNSEQTFVAHKAILGKNMHLLSTLGRRGSMPRRATPSKSHRITEMPSLFLSISSSATRARLLWTSRRSCRWRWRMNRRRERPQRTKRNMRLRM